MVTPSSRVLVTGAGGFTGRVVCEGLRSAQIQTFALEADLRDAAATSRVVGEVAPTHVIHLAAVSFVAHENVDEIYETNVLGTRHLLESLAALESKPTRVVLASSANVYGNAGGEPIDESTAIAPLNHYAATKAAMELVAMIYTSQLPLTIVRPFNYTGPGQGKHFLVPKLVDHFARRAPTIELGNLDVERDFSDVRDIARVYRELLDLDAKSGTVFNFCSGTSVKLKEILELLQQETGHSITVEVAPNLVRGAEITKLLGSVDRLRAAIGYTPRYEFRETIRAMLAE